MDNRKQQAKTYADAGVSLRDIGKMMGVSHECVRQWLMSIDYDLSAARRRARETKNEERLLRRIATFPKDRKCLVCDEVISVERYLGFGKNITTCSTDCADAWTVLRYRTEEGIRDHRQSLAKTILRNSERYGEKHISWAYRVIALGDDYQPKRRRYVLPNSKAEQLAQKMWGASFK